MKTKILIVLIVGSFSLFTYSFQSASQPYEVMRQSEIIMAANIVRIEKGLPSLKQNPKLQSAARDKISDMIAQQYFAHQSPEGISPWHWIEKSDYLFAAAGENLAINFVDPESLIIAWMESPAHKENLLNPLFSETGVSVQSVNAQDRTLILIVQIFGAPAKIAVK